MKTCNLIICLGILLLNGCNNAQQVNEKHRYISLAPANTEILFRLGLQDKLVGVTDFCNYPKEAEQIPSVGSFSSPSIEKIVSLKPDIIFTTGLEQAIIVENLRKLNLNVYICQPTNMEELFMSIEEIGKLTKNSAQAKRLIDSMKKEIAIVQAKLKKIPLNKRKKVFVEIWHAPLMTAGKGSFIDELIVLTGGINIAHNTPRPYSYFSAEKVVEYNPDYILLAHTECFNAENIKNRVGWKDITAVKEGNLIVEIDPDMFLRAGPRLVDALKQIHNRIYEGNRK
ncbi:MAG: cobalamin-binding protein [bacterium]